MKGKKYWDIVEVQLAASSNYLFCFVKSDGKKEDIFLVDRTLQALETIDWIRQTSSVNTFDDINGPSAPDLIILGGDLNTEPGFLPYKVLTQYGLLNDENGRLFIFYNQFKLEWK